MTVHLTLQSGGAGSYLTAGVVQRELVRPGDEHRMAFTDTLYEDADAYRFLLEGALRVFGRPAKWVPQAEDFPDFRLLPVNFKIEDYHGAPKWREYLRQLRERAAEEIPELIWIVEGRDIWEVYRDERFLGNSSFDPCSKITKRQPLDRLLNAEFDREDTVIYFGIGGAEAHRYAGFDEKTCSVTGIRPRFLAKGWNAQAPLIGRPEGELNPAFYLERDGLKVPRLYAWAAHNNCGGECCKAGVRHQRRRLENAPERFSYSAVMERKISDYLGGGRTFLEDRREGGRKPMSLFDLAERFKPGLDLEALIAADEAARADSGNGCGCMSEDDDHEAFA